jgi:hypothetical protein
MLTLGASFANVGVTDGRVERTEPEVVRGATSNGGLCRNLEGRLRVGDEFALGVRLLQKRFQERLRLASVELYGFQGYTKYSCDLCLRQLTEKLQF